ncbi:MAG: acyl-CoA dehydrogenase family protein [Spirochaetes bacterium]|nr:acyl-CoA dehydrogenase family protein [Spirochaetota bacterium]
MDFEIPENTKTILDMMEEFVQKELIPIENEYAHKSFKQMVPVFEEKRAMVKKMELWGPNLPKEYGGMGLGLVDHALVSEVLGQTPFGHFVFGCQAPDAGNIEILHQYGTPEQKEKYLRPLVEGKIRSCFSMTEPEMPGSNPVMMDTTAVKDGNEYVINGQKWFTSAADGAEFTIVMAVTNPQNPSYLRASMILVPINTPGLNIVRSIPVMGEVGDDWASHAEVLFQSCRVPVSNLLGNEGGGFVIAQERLGPGRIHHCMRWIGICNRAMDLMCRRAAARKIKEDGSTLAGTQIVRSWISECAAEIRSAKLMILHTAWLIDKFGKKEAAVEISLIKFFVAGVLGRVLDRAIQVHGGLGMTDDTVLSLFYRMERAARIYDGPDEVHKLTAGKRILKKYQTK